jgi:hypothetical protein
MNRNFIILGGIIFSIIIISIVFFLRKKDAKKSFSITVNILGENAKTLKFTCVKDDLSLSVSDFFKKIVILPKNLCLSSVVIGTQSITLQDCHITDSRTVQSLYTVLPDIITITVSYSSECNPDDKPECKGQVAICSPTGWVCQDIPSCPTGDDLYKACLTSPLGPFVTCKDGVITCGPCPGTKDCGEPGCKGIGPVCSPTGWVCKEGITCPSNPETCASCDSDSYATCEDGKISCVKCGGDKPDCNTSDCDLSGIVCKNGKLECIKGGRKCSVTDLNASCCPSNKPIPSCSDDGTKIICASCDPNNYPKTDPNYEKCMLGSCQGHGWVCTPGGWVCKEGVTCPPDDIAKSCCGTGQKSVATCVNNKVVCSCPNNTLTCDTLCCSKDIGCSKEPISRVSMCCPTSQVCNINNSPVCCPDGTICKDNTCKPICGTKNGQAVTCGQGQSCLIIENVDPVTLQSLENQGASVDGNTAYMCMSSQGCSFSPEQVSVPSSIDNYYPCYSFPVSSVMDPNNPGPGYCTDKDNNPTGKCNKYSTSDTCNNDSSCTWRNVLKYMASDSNPRNTWSQIRKELDVIQNSGNGNYCDPTNGKASYQRVLVFSGGDSCSASDCWGHVAQPGITDVEFNEENKLCVALQSCSGEGGVSTKVKTATGIIPNPNTQGLPSAVQASSFPSCDNSHCPIIDNSFMCNNQNGKIIDVTYDCINDTKIKGGQNCVLNPDGKGKYRDSSCNGLCSCANGYQRSLTTNKCYKKPFTQGTTGDYNVCMRDDPEYGNCLGFCDNQNSKNACGDTWKQSCSGVCGYSCKCSCSMNSPVPNGYMYCDKNGKQWKSCNNNSGCVNNDSWGSLSGGCAKNSELGSYCAIP